MKMAATMGMALREMASTKLFPVVVRTEIDYRKPALLGDFLQIHGKLTGLQGPRFWGEFTIHRHQPAELLITCRQSLALVQMPEGRPVRLPETWAKHWPDLLMKKTAAAKE